VDPLIFIEGEKSKLYRHLDQTFPASSLKAVTELAPTLAEVLCEWLRDRLVANAEILFPGCTQHKGRQPGIACDNRTFRIYFTTKPLDHADALPFVIAEHGGDGPPTLDEDVNPIKLTSLAQYRSLDFRIDRSVKVNRDLLDGLTRGLFAAGYQWLSNKIATAIQVETVKISTPLYDYMRSMLAETPDLLDGLLFSCLLDKKDFVILNEAAAEGALRLAGPTAERFRRSKEGIVLQLISEVVKIDESVIKDACASGEPTKNIALNPDSQYYRSDEDFFDSMQAVWGKEVVCCPIVREGEFLLVAFYPATNSERLTPTILVHVEYLAGLAKGQASEIRQHLAILETLLKRQELVEPKKSRGILTWAEAGGAFLGEILGRTIKNTAGA